MKKEFCDRCGAEIEEPEEKSFVQEVGDLVSSLLNPTKRELEKASITLFYDKKPYSQDVILCEECRNKFVNWLNEEKGGQSIEKR